MGCNPRGDLGTRLPRETFPGGMLGCLRRCWDLAVPLSRSSPRHPERPGCDGPWQDAAPSAGHQRLAGFPVPAKDFRSSVQEESASIRISITLFLVTLCKFFATSWMWGVLASNSSVTAQQFKQAVPPVKKIKGFVISHNKRGPLGRPSENLSHLGLLSDSRSTFLPSSASPYPQEVSVLKTFLPRTPCSQRESSAGSSQ